MMLGDSQRQVKIGWTCGVGKNCFIIKAEESGDIPQGQIKVQRIVVSYKPKSIVVRLIQQLAILCFRQLGSLKDYVDGECSEGVAEKEFECEWNDDKEGDPFDEGCDVD